MQPVFASVAALALGAVAACGWHFICRRSNTAPLFTALGRTVRTLLSDQHGSFLQEYGRLLWHTAALLLWNFLALAPILGLGWLCWMNFEDERILLVVLSSLSCLLGIAWLSRRSPAEASHLSVSDSQYFFLQVAEAAPWLLRTAAAVETRWLQRKLERIEIDRPIFIAGLARSGTTMLLELFAQVPEVATHRYRDFPFLFTPYFWSSFFSLFGARGGLVQRPHQDGMLISPESPEAFEEPIWQTYFPEAHRSIESHILDETHRNQAFDALFVEHLKKMLLLRGGNRYLSKGNYNITRLEYLASLFPDARFVVPIRHPATHVASLVRQHELFCEYARHDPRVPHYLSAAGHFEFGPQRVPISVNGSGKQSLAAWEQGEEHRGYAIQWAAVYGYVFELLERSPSLADRILVVRYEDLCDDPHTEVLKVLQHVQLEQQGSGLLEKLEHIQQSQRHCEHQEVIWTITAASASAFGYEPPKAIRPSLEVN